MGKQVDQLETLFKALADATRLRILGLLLTGEVCVCHIHESLRVPQSKVSRHLAYLRRAGLVQTRREGLWIYYRLAESGEPTFRAIVDTVHHVLGHVAEVRQDLARLQRETGCCLPVVHQIPGLSCCAPPPASLEESTRAQGSTSPATQVSSHAAVRGRPRR